jgi:predicted DCC family thiol-disulfide oxidoreductase YuxK
MAVTDAASGGRQEFVRLDPHAATALPEILSGTKSTPGFSPSADVYVAPIPKPAAPTEAGKPILLYNDECAVCRRVAAWVQREEDKEPGSTKLVLHAIGDDPDAVAALNPNLNIWDAYSAVHVLMPDGTMRVGGEAVAEVLKRLPDTAWFAGLFDVTVFGHRPFQAMLNLAYTVLDKIRPAFGCESCGEGPPKWAMPIAWAVRGWKALFGSKTAPNPEPRKQIAPAATIPAATTPPKTTPV